MELSINRLLYAIAEKNPLQARYIKRAKENSDNLINESMLTFIIGFWEKRGLDVEDLADAYLDLVYSTMEEQLYFKKNHKYRDREYQAICIDNYCNNGYMERYLAALAISDCLWANHIQVLDWYKDKLKTVEECGKYVEVGCGCGMNLLPVLQTFSNVEITAIDLSEKAIEICKELLQYATDQAIIVSNKYSVFCKDIFEYEFEVLPDILTMFEVLEHVPDPQVLLQRIYNMTNSGTVYYISTVINSPMPDHIYLFRNKEEIFELISKVGFEINDYYCAPANGLSLEEAESKETPITIAMELMKGNR